MTSSWAVESCGGRRRGDHLFWTYRDEADLAGCVLPFITEGLEAGERIVIAAPGTAEELNARFNPDLRLDPAVQSGQVVLLEVDTFPALIRHTGPREDRELWRGLSAAARRDGYTSLRLVGDGTTGAVEPGFVDRLVAFDAVLTELCVEELLTCLCLYDARLVGAALEDVACAHPQAQSGTTPFVLHRAATDELVLSGTLDALSARVFATALDRIRRNGPGGGELFIDAAGVEFLDHRALLALEELARVHRLRAVLRGAPPLTSRLTELLQLEQVSVEGDR